MTVGTLLWTWQIAGEKGARVAAWLKSFGVFSPQNDLQMVMSGFDFFDSKHHE